MGVEVLEYLMVTKWHRGDGRDVVFHGTKVGLGTQILINGLGVQGRDAADVIAVVAGVGKGARNALVRLGVSGRMRGLVLRVTRPHGGVGVGSRRRLLVDHPTKVGLGIQILIEMFEAQGRYVVDVSFVVTGVGKGAWSDYSWAGGVDGDAIVALAEGGSCNARLEISGGEGERVIVIIGCDVRHVVAVHVRSEISRCFRSVSVEISGEV